MKMYQLQIFGLSVALFLASWLVFHHVQQGYITGSISVRNGRFLRSGSGLRNASDYWAVMVGFSLAGLIFFVLLLASLLVVPSTLIGQVLTLASLTILFLISARRQPSKHSKPLSSFSIISIISTIPIAISTTYNTTKEVIPIFISLATLLTLTSLIIVHAVRLKTGKFFRRFKKPK